MRLLLLVLLLSPAARAMTAFEMGVVAEMNLLRTQPQTYLGFLREERAYYNGLLYRKPGGRLLQMKEGLPALEEAIAALEQQPAVGPLEPSPGLALGCMDHVLDQGRTGAIGHPGSDGSLAPARAQRYGVANGVGENIAYGLETPRDVVIQLVVDDGVPDRGHRVNCFRPGFLFIGVAYGAHPRLRTECVINMAAGYGEDASAQKARSALTVPLPPPAGALASRPARPSAPQNPYQAARAAADDHYRSSLSADRPAWVATFTQEQKAYASALWRVSQEAAVGATYTYSSTEKTRPDFNRFRYLRRAGGKITPCFITVVCEAGRWLVADVSY